MIDETTKISLSLFTVPAIVSGIIILAYKFFSAKFGTTARVEKLEDKYSDISGRVIKVESDNVTFRMDILEIKNNQKWQNQILEEIKKKLDK